jgi:signal transduction histidine kinase
MRLADFIVSEMEAILAHWQAFAATNLPAAARMSALALRDHAQQILRAVSEDLRTPQTRLAQAEKAMGRAPELIDAPETAAQTHALLRAQSGFDIKQLVAEYRALRASVLRLWLDEHPRGEYHVDDIVRFNEAIDQAVAESVSFFSAQVDRARDLFLGMLGHDMRSPLQTIQTTATYLAALNASSEVTNAAARLMNSGARMKALLDDLVDFNRTKLGLGMNIAPTDVDVAQLFSELLDALRTAHPARRIELDVAGDARGVWDGRRLQQLLSNLVVNALKYGAPAAPVRVFLRGDDTDLSFDVSNTGTIDPATFEHMFDPLRQGAEHANKQGREDSLGLGLFISREIARAHGGEISARCDETNTVFTVRVPRRSQREHFLR